MSDHPAPDESPAVEPDRTPNAIIAGVTLATVALLAILIAGLTEVYDHLFADEFARKVLETPNLELRKLRLYEEERLTRYQWVDEKAGLLRIPVERATELVIAERAAEADAPAGAEVGQ